VRRLLALLVLGAAAAACTSSPGDGERDATPDEVVLVSYDAFTPAEGAFDEFTRTTGARVRVVTGGDSGTVVSRAILTAGTPEGDVLWGVDDTTLARAERARLFERVADVDTGDVCVNVDDDWYARRGLAAPSDFDDLFEPAWRGHLVVQNPVTSAPGTAFLLATIARYGDGWRERWADLVDNDVLVVNDWSAAYTIEFSGSSGAGSRPLVVSYGSSPPAEVVFAAEPVDEPGTSVMEDTCLRITERAGVLRGTRNPRLADALLDHLLSRTFQETMPLSLFVFPIDPSTPLPDVFRRFAARPVSPLRLDAAVIDANLEAWLAEWRGIVL
jgi:thiamine transport system substrate-binding protein